MILLTYIGILLFCFGIYNMLCYLSMLPTLTSVRNMTNCGKKTLICHNNALLITLAEIIVKKWELGLNSSERMIKILYYNRIYTPATVYFVSQILTALCGLFLCLPLLFWNVGWFIVMAIGVIVIVLADPVILFHRYKGQMPAEKTSDQTTEKRNKWAQKCIRLLPGVFFLCQIILSIAMLT